MTNATPPPELSARQPGERRRRTKWLLGGLLVLDLALLLVALAFANVTAVGPAKRALARSVAILTEVDALLDANYDSLREEAASSNAILTLASFPIDVAFTPEEVLASDRDSFRELLLARAADRVHEDGVATFRADRDAGFRLISTEGTLRAAMDFLRPTPHGIAMTLVYVFAATAAALALGLVLATRGYGKMLALGLSVLLAATPVLITAVAVRFVFRLAADGVDDYLAQQFFELSQELAWAPIRNGIIFCTSGGILLVAGAILSRWSDGRQHA